MEMRSLVRLAAGMVIISLISGVTTADSLTVCSINIKWLGYYEERECEALGHVLSNYDVIVIQEIVAPPYPGTFPNGEPYKPDPEVTAFFDEMAQARGYDYLLSEEDTGRSSANHYNSSWTEWYAVFYDHTKLEVASGLPQEFIADDVTANPAFDRVPHAFSLRHLETGFDFVLISVHLRAGDGQAHEVKRAGELEAIAAWVDAQTSDEEHYIVLGDMNFEDCSEILAIVPDDFLFLNPDPSGNCLGTNTSLGTKHPYDNVLYTQEVPLDPIFGMRVIDLVTGLAAIWNPFGDPIEEAYSELDFVKRISDHNPIVFTIQLPSGDQD